MNGILLNWVDFKNIINKKNINIQYYEISTKLYYYVFAYDGTIKYECEIDKDSDDATDFETNYIINANKNIDPKDEHGSSIVAPTLDTSLGLTPKRKMYQFSITAEEININDVLVSVEKKINGGEYWICPDSVSHVHDDDHIEFSVVDKDDTLELFSTYGLTQGVDVLELSKFIITDYIKKGNSENGFHSQNFEGITGTSKVIAGLYLRASYHSYGTTNLKFLWRLYYYE